MAKCRGCKAEIKWIQTKKGKWLPCDPEEVSGEEANEHDWKKDVLLVTEDGEIISNPDDNDRGYVPHWATCPNADEFRKDKEK